MKSWKLRLASAALAACMITAAATPAFAATQTNESAQTSSVVSTLLDVPLIGHILRLFIGDDKAPVAAATAEDAATMETAESAATTETAATPETGTTAQNTATPAPATDTVNTAATPAPAANAATATPAPAAGASTATPAPTPAQTVSWPAAWMQGAAQTGKVYPLGSKDATQMTVAETQWGDVTLYSGAVLRAASREETNLGDLATDAMAMAAAADSRYQTDADLNKLPVVAVLNGASLSGVIEAGTAIDEKAASAVLADGGVALVTVTPLKLKEILNAAMVDMLNASGANFGGFLQVSGLRFTYTTTNGAQQVSAMWLADAATAEGKALDINNNTDKIALALPAALRDSYGVNAVAGYTDWLDGAGITLRSALLALPVNADAATLSAMLARGGSTGRILPVTAASFDTMLAGGYTYANHRMKGLLDGKEIEFYIDGNGSLILQNLAPGSHTFRMKAGEPAYYISSITHIGTADGSVVQIASIPADCVLGAMPSAAPTAAPTAAPANTNDIAAETSNDSENATATPAPAPAAAAATPQKASTATAKSTAAPIKDPTAGTILNTTPAPTIKPTPTPTAAPTPTKAPTPTPDPEALEKMAEAEKTSSNLPLYIGLGVLAACVVVGGGAFVKRKLDDKKYENIHKK